MNKAEAPVITCQILMILFDVQQFGTDKVGFAFALIILLWFAFISGIGVYNFITHGVTVLPHCFGSWVEDQEQESIRVHATK
ncbi:unnamed protein product, partial [Prunus brigantina]